MRNFLLGPPNYRPIGWNPGGFTWLRPWSQLIRAQNGQIVPGSPNGLHSGLRYLGPAPGPHVSRVLQSGNTAPASSTSMVSPGLQSFLPIQSNQTLAARPYVIGPQ